MLALNKRSRKVILLSTVQPFKLINWPTVCN